MLIERRAQGRVGILQIVGAGGSEGIRRAEGENVVGGRQRVRYEMGKGPVSFGKDPARRVSSQSPVLPFLSSSSEAHPLCRTEGEDAMSVCPSLAQRRRLYSTSELRPRHQSSARPPPPQNADKTHHNESERESKEKG